MRKESLSSSGMDFESREAENTAGTEHALKRDFEKS
jgi:hypothetical protein